MSNYSILEMILSLSVLILETIENFYSIVYRDRQGTAKDL